MARSGLVDLSSVRLLDVDGKTQNVNLATYNLHASLKTSTSDHDERRLRWALAKILSYVGCQVDASELSSYRNVFGDAGWTFQQVCENRKEL
jgi:hypothetical protein